MAKRRKNTKAIEAARMGGRRGKGWPRWKWWWASGGGGDGVMEIGKSGNGVSGGSKGCIVVNTSGNQVDSLKTLTIKMHFAEREREGAVSVEQMR